ncbi:MAG: protein kinase family protein, partial [Actinobacteria bacterium]|nr:protein kinase family protein [Actinomycetota bacterium]
MSTFISDPGTRLGGRYRLEDRVSASDGWSAWKAIDEILARPVAVLTFAPGFPRIREVVTAARAASRLTDARLAQVFDVEDNWDQAYVVMEWVTGDSLDDLLADGPLEPARSAEIIAEGAEALASAHAAGLAHLCLNPTSLRWSPFGGLKIAGVGIDAALSGITTDDPALADTIGLGRLLYAALTAHWPGPAWPTLAPAPEADGQLCAPHQVRAGVPAALDEITCRALFQQRHGGPPLATPAMLADALATAMPAPLLPPPVAAPAGRGYRNDSGYQASYGTGYDTGYGTRAGGTASRTGPGHWDAGPAGRHGGPPAHHGGRAGGGWSRIAMIVAGVAVVLIIALLVLAVRTLGNHGGAPARAGSHHASSAPPAASKIAVLTPASAHGF